MPSADMMVDVSFTDLVFLSHSLKFALLLVEATDITFASRNNSLYEFLSFLYF